MYKIVNTPETKTTPNPKTDIFSRSESIRKGANSYTLPGSSLSGLEFDILKTTNFGIKSVATPEGNRVTDPAEEAETLKGLADDLSSAVLLPPSEDYSTIIPPEGVAVSQQIEEITKKQFVQKFYETYMVPIGCKEIYNRLGTIAGNVTDVHSLYPKGLQGLIAADARASWKINTNFSFTVVGELGNEKYSSLSFPPFISRDAANIADLFDPLEPDANESTFDMQNVLYKGNTATFRFPAFKQVNDNINFLQVLLNRCFGVESTYMNEWDLSIYMQEGILSYIEKVDQNDDILRVPQFVTTLTYGLLDDAPVDALNNPNGSQISSEEVNIDKATPFASVNCAVSTRYGVDNEALGQAANTLNYVIADYPYSAYWYPWDEGANSLDMNVSLYIDALLSYRDNGEAYNENNPTGHWYTPAIFHGSDLGNSTKRFRSVLRYSDHRNAILSGWNSTDSDGTVYQPGSDRTNESVRSNAYSYLPFWKQFYTNADDGLSDLDKYIQEIYAKDSEVSFINAAYQIIGMMTSGNTVFQDYCSDKSPSAVGEVQEDGEALDTSATSTAARYGADDISDYSFKLFKCKLKIPGSSLLKMFLNRNKQRDKAMSKADEVSNNAPDTPDGTVPAGSTTSPSALAKSATPTKTLGEPATTIIDGQEVEVSTYVPEDNDDLASKKTVGDGIAEWSPMLYGGPHGKYNSPLTLEGFTQYNNQMLANVPTVDPYAVFTGKTLLSRGSIRGLEFSKNWKHDGSYIDTVTCVTPNEREVLLKQPEGVFGVRNLKPNTGHWFPYYSNIFPREYFWDTQKWISIKIFWCTIRIPNFFYYKICRTHNGEWDRGLWFPYDYGTAAYNTRFDTSKFENDVSAQEDWLSEEFRLIPTCGWQSSFDSYNKDSAWDYNKTLENIRYDQNNFRKSADWTIDSTSGEVIYKETAENCKPGTGEGKYTLRDGNYVKYLIAPVSEGSDTNCGSLDSDLYPSADHRWLHWTTYSSPGTKWYNQLKNMYNAGTRELTISLPIVNSNAAGKPIINIIGGVANIYKSRGISWTWKLVTTRHLCYRYVGWWWWRHSVSFWCYHYSWVLVRCYEDTYNMYFNPCKVQWNLPTDSILNREAIYTSQRNPNSVNIIERWCTDGANDAISKRFSSIGTGSGYSPDLFPFTEQFMSKYGAYEPHLPLPGVTPDVHTREAGNIGILRSKGLYWQDILQSYKTKGYVESIKSVKAIYKTFEEPRTYYDTAAGVRYDTKITIGGWTINLNPLADLFRFFFGAFYERKSTFSVERDLFWTAYNPVYIVDQLEKQTELTNILDKAQGWPTIQEYQIDRRPYMTWYKPTDTIGVFIDTAKQQIAWLEQLRDYAELYLTDKLIWEVYQKGVDQKIQNIIEFNLNGDVKNGQDYKTGCGGWTSSFTEDINYHDALALARKVFKTTDPERNTIYDLTVGRIKRIKALIVAAEKLKSEFNTNPTEKMHEFMRLVTNTKAYLDCAVTNGTSAESAIFNAAGDYSASGSEFPIYDENDSGSEGNTTFNLIKDPGAVLWAYINVLYQVRKYWVNMRFNKRAGSYWQLRGLERVLTFMLANSTGEDSVMSPEKHIPQGTSEELKTKPIVFVQPRDNFTEQLNNTEKTITNTKAVYTKVNYLGTPNPTKSSKWDEESQTYSGEEIVYVNEAYRWAKKPQDGLYYVMSKAISDTVTGLMNTLKIANNLIAAKTYQVTADDVNQVKILMRSSDLEATLKGLGLTSAETQDFTKSKNFGEYEDYLDAIGLADKKLSQIEKDIARLDTNKYNTQIAENVVRLFTNLLIDYKRSYYLAQVKDYLYAVYIKWQPSQIWTGLEEQDENGAWHIDEWQKEETAGKERVVTDLYGYDHKSSDAISAGITFDVSAGIDAGNLLSSPTLLKNSSLLEVLCSSVDKMDLWRVELPENLDIPITLLNESPVLVPAYQIDAALSGLTAKKVTKSTKSVLAGIASNSILPVLEPTEAMLSIDALSALGKFDDISQTGLSVDSVVSSGN